MILEVYSVFDKAVGAFLPPIFIRSRGEMMRSFQSAVNSPDHQFAAHAADYTLMALGLWDDQSGMFSAIDPERVIGALELLEPKK
jgi:hypothetical protein